MWDKIKGGLREELSKRVYPVGYKHDFLSDIAKAAVSRRATQDISKTRKDLFRTYLGLQQQHGRLEKGRYKPTISKNPNANYLKLSDESFLERPGNSVIPGLGAFRDIDDLKDLSLKQIEAIIRNNPERAVKDDIQMGEYIQSRGFDPERNEPYISYYDNWDLDTGKLFTGLPGTLLQKSGLNINKVMSPFELYDRLYAEDYKRLLNKWNGQAKSKVATNMADNISTRLLAALRKQAGAGDTNAALRPKIDRGPTPEERAAFLAALQKEHEVGGARGVVPELTMGAAAGRALGVPGAVSLLLKEWNDAFGRESRKKYGAMDNTILLNADMPGNVARGVPNLAEIILAVPEKKLPNWFRTFLKGTKEEQIPAAMHNFWTKLGEGHFREGYRHKGVVGKLGFNPWGKRQNVEEFLTFIQDKNTGRRGNIIQTPSPLALSTKTGASFMRAQNPDNNALANFSNFRQNSNLPDEIDNYVGKHGISDVWGDYKKNWFPMLTKSGPEKAIIYDKGLEDPPSSVKLMQILKESNPDLYEAVRHNMHAITTPLSSSAEKFLQILKQQLPKTKVAGQ